MIMKQTFVALCFLFFAGKGICQQATYTLPLPAKWGVEKIAFPIQFAPSIPYKGIEEIRFTPGWGDNKSAEYWSYTFLWFIEGSPVINLDTLKNCLTQYYNGLYLSNQKGNVPTDKNFSQIQLKKIGKAKDDLETYEGKISTLNFLNKLPLSLNARIHIRKYPAVNHTVVLYEISPQDFKHEVWGAMNGIVDGFKAP
ncbi:MAG: hypothetical protein JWR09_4266 [Mucilaginibacter sp.]|nr:hypothetical protein [Mucilaginibacter sp.]